MKIHESPDQVSIMLQTFRIGDLGIAAIPFEVFTETGLEIKQKSPFKPTFTHRAREWLVRLLAYAPPACARRL